jgi:hypothetical protein
MGTIGEITRNDKKKELKNKKVYNDVRVPTQVPNLA